MKTCILIPARLASTRLPNKPLADILGVPMVLRVAMAARAAGFGEPVIAAADLEIHECATTAGFHSVVTRPDLPSGTDRISAALHNNKDLADVQIVVNLQGDLPTICPDSIRAVVKTLISVPSADIATLVAPIQQDEERDNPDVVKAVLSPLANTKNNKIFQALYFSRTAIPSGDGPLYHHIGIYAYRREALEKFTALAPSPLEKRESLEQLRALENNMQIVAGLVDKIPLGVDSPADLQMARKIIGEQRER